MKPSRVLAPKSNWIQAVSLAALDQRVPVLPSMARAALWPPSTADDVAATTFTARPGWLTSTPRGSCWDGGSVGAASGGGLGRATGTATGAGSSTGSGAGEEAGMDGGVGIVGAGAGVSAGAAAPPPPQAASVAAAARAAIRRAQACVCRSEPARPMCWFLSTVMTLPGADAVWESGAIWKNDHPPQFLLLFRRPAICCWRAAPK